MGRGKGSFLAGKGVESWIFGVLERLFLGRWLIVGLGGRGEGSDLGGWVLMGLKGGSFPWKRLL